MQPKKGYVKYEHTIQRHAVSQLDKRNALNGKNIHLTILEPIQAIVEDEMDKLMSDVKPKACYAIMANPRTGAIMALSQRPKFNPNNRSDRKNMAHKDPRYLLDIYDPGSTMKAISIGGALHYNQNLTLGTRFYCEKGIWYYAGRPLHDAGHAYEWLRVWEIIQKSSNIGTIKACLTAKRWMWQNFMRFGFGKRTGINLGAESPGILWPENFWSKLSYGRLPIGQGISVTPLQMVQAYCAIANKGRMMQLHVVDKISEADSGKVFKYFEPKIKKESVIGEGAADDMVRALKSVTKKGGTAVQAAIPGYEVAGKTGTAQKVINKKDPRNTTGKAYYSKTIHVSSFIGFVPADNPEFVLYIVVDEPPYKYRYGGKCAAPYFKRIAEQTLNFLNIAPTEKVKK
ncbi:MAG: penicillin-binding protein 2 [Lentisphaeraceae bacterium]|nr:penicillin-binding protein 2 [Lentisphaeraceae bacterium]